MVFSIRDTVTPTKKRSKFRKFFGFSKSKPADKASPANPPKTVSLPSKKTSRPISTHAAAGITPDAKDKTVMSTAPKGAVNTTTAAPIVTRPRLDIFSTNVAKPAIRTDLPKKQDRLERTPQLVYCTGLLPRDGSSLSPFTEPQDQETIFDETQRDWLKAMEHDLIEQDHIRWLGTRMVEEFVKDPYKDSVEISEIVLLGPVLQKEHYRRLLSCTITEFEKSVILDIDLLQGLVQLVQSTSPGFLVSDDLVKILSILRTRLEGTHQQSSEHPYHLTLAVSRILDVMAEHKVQDLDRVVQHEPLSAVLSGLRGSSDPESGRGVLDSLKEGLGSGQKRPWYAALRAAHAFVQGGQLADLNRFICEAPCRRDPLFQWGICQLLGEIAIDSIWETSSRQQAIDLLENLYKDDADWAQDESVEAWILAIIAHLGVTSDQTVSERARALLQGIETGQGEVSQHPFPLRSRLPTPLSSPILARVQNIPYVEYDLHKLRLQQLEEGRQAVYIPPQAKSTLLANDDHLFPLMEKVQEFLASDRQVMLILGDSGSGKSTFNRHLEHELWTRYKQGGPIPLFINLPSIHRPEQDMVAKQLQAYNFSDAQIQELKYRHLVLICDGYDESQLLVNLHKTNLLNQPGQWNTKMVISCRTQFLGPTYLDRFRPQLSDRYSASTADLFQQAVIAPFTKDQINEYIDQFRSSVSTRLLLGDQPVWSTKEYMDKLTAIPNLMDLVKNPFLLTLALKTLPKVVDTKQDLSSIRITRVGLYDKFVTQWLEINILRLQNSSLTHEESVALNLLVDDNFVLAGIDYMKRLSASLFKEQNGNPAVQYSPLREKKTWKAEFFRPDPEIRLLREASPLTRTGNLYRFIHRSVMEYFYSRMVYDPNTADFDPQPPSFSAGLFSSISVHPLSQMSLVIEPSIVQFLAERAQSSPTFKEQLVDIIELSKTEPQASQAAANAITILVKAGVKFYGTDLRDARIPGADLSGGQFDSVQFQGADLRGVKLARSWLRRSDLSSARMEDVQFEESPFLQESSIVWSCAYSPDGKMLAVGLEADCDLGKDSDP
ncbi:Transducin (beta)-like 1 X-linked receptor 1 [Linnemannia gamsii]|uniref:Transducin (Beta)-like 1 X-linked receptor 1 n=1 Tax=Linnemannia gamsii TaxID=64522 RepID=A0A9P6RIX2_9FUNG|nr:Transducin (beta)-like 1 X-linked receptor 1 [Linnemannia gamsii]